MLNADSHFASLNGNNLSGKLLSADFHFCRCVIYDNERAFGGKHVNEEWAFTPYKPAIMNSDNRASTAALDGFDLIGERLPELTDKPLLAWGRRSHD